jgi:hypothetical protein
MKKILVCLLLLLPILSKAQISLSAQSKISVITCGPYQGELYSAFGHSAFRVYDPAKGIDEAYNYGVFDFNQPHFYLNFARGYLYYKLGVYDYKAFEYYYIYHNRSVHEQVLNLNQQQKQKLYDYLLWNAEPENQYYRYDYFYDNCATKMRDVVATVFKDSVKFDGSYITTDYTIRDLTDIYLKHQPWGDLGIDICLGLPMDKKASPYEYMFLPDYVESGFAHASLGTVATPLVKETNRVFDAQEETISFSFFHPAIIFSFFLILTLAISYRDWKRKKITHFYDAIVFTVVGLLGLVLFLLWIATDHKAAAKNFNLLWALPTHLIAVIAFLKQPKWLKKYFLVITVICVLLLVGWPLLPQQLNYSLIPVVIALGARSFVQYSLRKEES